jgi:hypothetical protein
MKDAEDFVRIYALVQRRVYRNALQSAIVQKKRPNITNVTPRMTSKNVLRHQQRAASQVNIRLAKT